MVVGSNPVAVTNNILNKDKTSINIYSNNNNKVNNSYFNNYENSCNDNKQGYHKRKHKYELKKFKNKHNRESNYSDNCNDNKSQIVESQLQFFIHCNYFLTF